MSVVLGLRILPRVSLLGARHAYWQFLADGRVLAGVMRVGDQLAAIDVAHASSPQRGFFDAGGRTYQVTSIPTFILFKGGQVADRVLGALPRSEFVKFIDRNIS